MSQLQYSGTPQGILDSHGTLSTGIHMDSTVQCTCTCTLAELVDRILPHPSPWRASSVLFSYLLSHYTFAFIIPRPRTACGRDTVVIVLVSLLVNTIISLNLYMLIVKWMQIQSSHICTVGLCFLPCKSFWR